MSFTAYERSIGGVNAAVAAAGNSQATATALTAGRNVITSATATSADGVRLPAGWGVGEIMYIANNTAVAVDMFPPTDGAIGGGSDNAAVAIAANKMAVVMSLGNDDWAIAV